MESFMERMERAMREREAEEPNPQSSTECFCYICGGTSTWAQLLKSSTFVEDRDEGQAYDFDTLYDHCSCSASGCLIHGAILRELRYSYDFFQGVRNLFCPKYVQMRPTEGNCCPLLN